MKKILAIILVLTLALCAFAGCGAKDDTTAKTPADTSADEVTTKNFVIATDKGFSPFEFQDADGNIVGIDMDILAAIAEDQGFTYDLQ